MGALINLIAGPEGRCFEGRAAEDGSTPMNVHHLELFYYVAKHGGISAAVRHIPYGIQQPAVSGQMAALEDQAGVRLFERTPFRLTTAGKKLFAHIEPFFAGLPGVADKLRGEERPELRLGASGLLLLHHIPTVTRRLRAQFPNLQLSMRSGYQAQFETWLADGVIDIAVVPIDERPSAKFRQLRLTRVPLVLIVPRKSPIKTAAELWKQKKVAVPLIGLPQATSVMRSFQRDMKRLGATWNQSIEATSMELVTSYVAAGEGYGVNLAPGTGADHPEVRALPLDGFKPISVGLRWKGEPSELVRSALIELQRYTRETWPEWSIDDELATAKKPRKVR